MPGQQLTELPAAAQLRVRYLPVSAMARLGSVNSDGGFTPREVRWRNLRVVRDAAELEVQSWTRAVASGQAGAQEKLDQARLRRSKAQQALLELLTSLDPH